VLHIPKSIHSQLLSLATSAKPLEIVGLLGGSELTRISTIVPLENNASDPTRRFEAERRSLVHGLKALRESRLELCALYHSHPNGPALPSRVDLENAQWDVPMLIVDAVTLTVRAWRLVDGSEVKLEVMA
jgi:proteasome lid subunit RPN8/RPN11